MKPKHVLTALTMIRHRMPEGGDKTFRTWADGHLHRMIEWATEPDAPLFTAEDLLRGALTCEAAHLEGTAERRFRRIMADALKSVDVEPAEDTVGAVAIWSYFLFRAQSDPEAIKTMGLLLRREVKELARKMRDR